MINPQFPHDKYSSDKGLKFQLLYLPHPSLSLMNSFRGYICFNLQKARLRDFSGLTWVVEIKKGQRHPKINGKVHHPPGYKDTLCLSKKDQQITMEICPNRQCFVGASTIVNTIKPH